MIYALYFLIILTYENEIINTINDDGDNDSDGYDGKEENDDGDEDDDDDDGVFYNCVFIFHITSPF